MANKTGETWAGAAKAIALRSFSSGRFWQVAFLLFLVAWVRQIKSEDWVRIAELFFSTQVYGGLGWVLWVMTVVTATIVHRAQRMRYLSEITRITDERNEAQKKHLPDAKPSKYKSK